MGTVTINNSTVSGNKASFSGGGTYTRSGTIIVNDSEVINNSAFEGAGIGIDWYELGDVANLTLNRSQVSHNSTTFEGRGGGIYSIAAVITLRNSSVTDNVAGLSGGGMSLAGDTATLNDSTVSGNTAAFAGGIAASRCFPCQASGHLTLNRSTINGNSAQDTAAGEGKGGGIVNLSSVVSLNNSTISGNFAQAQGGGILNWSALPLVNSTVARNSAGTGGGIFTEQGTTDLTNTIVADNTAANCSGPVTSSGHNLDSDGSCTLASAGDISGGNSNLGPLQDNGGATFTHELLTGSQAIDAGDDASCPAPPISGLDQRGVSRPQGSHCDIGAYELVQPTAVAIDIKPGSDPNCFNNNGQGVIPVAILTADAFDAANVDPFSVRLDGAAARVKGKSGNVGAMEDVDGDDDLDLVVQIEDIYGTFPEGDTVATLSGLTFDGTEIEGTDTICIGP